MKTIIVMSADWKTTVEIDHTIFDDVFAEACTRVLEEMAKTKQIRLTDVMMCWEQSKDSTMKMIFPYNSYKMLINAGMHKLAETFRQQLLKYTNVDWATEPLTSGIGKKI